MDAAVKKKFDSYPGAARERLLYLRNLIFEIAEVTEGVGEIEETLKWGEPAYLTAQTGSGTTIRIGWHDTDPDHYGIYVHCQTTLIEEFRTVFQNEIELVGNRAIRLPLDRAPDKDILGFCIAAAQRYHLDKKKG